MDIDHKDGRNDLMLVLTNVFHIQDDHPLMLAFREHGFHNIYDIVDASHKDIDDKKM